MICTDCGTEFDAEKNKLTGRRGCFCGGSGGTVYVCPECGKKHNRDGTAYDPAVIDSEAESE